MSRTEPPRAHILIVDDEVSIREPLRGFLESLGYRVTERTNGMEGLLALTEHDYDLVLSDVMMPKMNGFQFLERALPYTGARTPFIILSSMADAEGVQAAIMAGAFDYLLKPCDPERAERVLDAALAQRADEIQRQGPYGAKGPVVPADVLERHPLEQDKAPKVVPPSGQDALKRKSGTLSVAAPAAPTTGAAADAEAEKPGLLGRLKGLFGRSRDAA